MRFNKNNISPKLWAIDKAFGNIAYGVFLVHYPLGVLVLGGSNKILRFLELPAMTRHTLPFFIITVLLSIVAAFFMHKYFETTVNHMRDRIRGKAAFGA